MYHRNELGDKCTFVAEGGRCPSTPIGSGQFFTSRDGTIFVIGPCGTTVNPWISRSERNHLIGFVQTHRLWRDNAYFAFDFVVNQEIYR